MWLRPYRPADSDQILAIYGPIIAHSSATFEVEVPSLKDFSERLARIAERFPFWVAEDANGSILGYAYATTHRERIAYQWAVETSVYVAPTAHRRGLAAHSTSRFFRLCWSADSYGPMESSRYPTTQASLCMPPAATNHLPHTAR